MKYFLIIIVTFFLSDCFASNFRIKLSHKFSDEVFALNEKTYTSVNNEELTFSRLKYYLGNIVLNYDNGDSYTDLVRYHLIDLDNPETMILELNNVPEGNIKTIKFSIGVDSLTNSNGLMEGDLDPLKGMYWAWSSGFINFKLEGSCVNCESNKEFTYHIGGFIAPYQSFQTTLVAVEQEVSDKDVAIEMIVNIGEVFLENKASLLHKVMSPSKTSKCFSEILPQMFSIKL